MGQVVRRSDELFEATSSPQLRQVVQRSNEYPKKKQRIVVSRESILRRLAQKETEIRQ